MDKNIEAVSKKISPFFHELNGCDKTENFDVSDWLIEGTLAFEFAIKNLTIEERDVLYEMVYASMLLEA